MVQQYTTHIPIWLQWMKLVRPAVS